LRVSVTFTPVEVGDMNATVFVENVNNENNFSTVKLKSLNVLNEVRLFGQ
jgi:hypothetical protein